MEFLHPLPKTYHKVFRGFDWRYPYTPFFIVRGLAGKKHGGWDIICPTGTPLVSPGRIQQTRAGWSPSYGNVVYASSLDVPGLEFRFAHLSVIGNKRIGKIWQKGEVFAWTGNTGFSTNPHLHLETLKGGKAFDPASLVFK